MFTQLGIWINTFLSGYVAAIVSDLCTELAPIAALLLTIYVATYGFALARGEASESLAVFFWKMIKKTFVTTFALGAGAYMNVIVSMSIFVDPSRGGCRCGADTAPVSCALWVAPTTESFRCTAQSNQPPD